jgi:hypothetical protein
MTGAASAGFTKHEVQQYFNIKNRTARRATA